MLKELREHGAPHTGSAFREPFVRFRCHVAPVIDDETNPGSRSPRVPRFSNPTNSIILYFVSSPRVAPSVFDALCVDIAFDAAGTRLSKRGVKFDGGTSLLFRCAGARRVRNSVLSVNHSSPQGCLLFPPVWGSIGTPTPH
jgi:hypothetical protein